MAAGKGMRKLVSLTAAGALVLSVLNPFAAIHADAKDADTIQSDKTLQLWYDEPAPVTGIDNSSRDTDTGFEQYSLPLGCGYMGANVWGGTDTEAVYITENSLANMYAATSGNSGTSNRTGLNLLAKTWIDFGHAQSKVKNYKRDLVLDDATAHVNYEYEGVNYSREYFTSYPDKIMAIRLKADQDGKISFTLRPEAPYLHPFNVTDTKDIWAGRGKTGEVTAEITQSGEENKGTIVLAGSMEAYSINYEGQYRVVAEGGTMEKSSGENGEQLEIRGADSAVIYLAVGTNYKMTEETFLNSQQEKLDANEFPHDKVTGYLDEAMKYSYEELRERHVEDYRTYYARADLDLGGTESGKTTDQLLSEYKKGTYDPYLEEVFFQYGRYLLIASSREGCLPANLQGIWNAYEDTPWSGGYWHNINVQMNYWPAFVTNMPELFESYADFNEAFRRQAETNADQYLESIGSQIMAEPGTGENGWAIGTGVYPYTTEAPKKGSHSGPGTGGFTTALFWDWYDFTRDESILEEHTYPAVEGMAKFLSKSLIEQDGKYLISPSASPENAGNKQTVGCAFDQQMTWENYSALIKSADILGVDSRIIQTAREQIDKLDPVTVGYSGQVKEYPEEDYYGEFGEYQHRHISQLVGLYPGTSINNNTPAWLDAAKYTLGERGLGSTGWSIAHRLCAWARVGDGEMCYKELQQLLKTKIMENLWDTHPPFQIDGNFGATAGIGEMLLQSHEGYIAPLAALPSAWSDGSYDGLLARGNFVVDADWKDGKATQFAITSQSGGSCKVSYPGLAEATVKDSSGNTVECTADGMDMITFDAVKGESYTITGIPKVEETEAPTALALSGTEEGMELTWKESSSAQSYNVYIAVNNDPDYELVAENVKGTSYLYTKEEIAERTGAQDRVTMRVTAVGENGRESGGVTAQMLPVTEPQKVTGYFTSDTALRLEISDTEGADRYNVYEKDGDTWKRLYSTEYTTAYIENAHKDSVYAVSAESFGRESGKTEAQIKDSGVLDNILLNKPVTLTSGQSIHANYPLTNVVNGKADPSDNADRVGFNGDTKGAWTMEADLQGTYTLDTLTIVEWKNGESKTRSKSTKVEYLNESGTWVTVKEGFPLEWGGSVAVDMGGAAATKLRLTFDNQGDPAKYACITEIMCSAKMPETADKMELFQELQALSGLSLKGYVISPEVQALSEAKAEGAALLGEMSAGQEEVDAAAEKMRAAREAFEKADVRKNLMVNQKIEASAPPTDNRYPVEAMVDGDTSTRYAGRDTDSRLTVTVTLDHIYQIDTFYIQEFLEKNNHYQTRGGETSIEVLSDGKWVTVVDKVSLKSEPDVDGNPQGTNILKPEDGPVKASAVRYSFRNLSNSKRITIFELQASGERVVSVENVGELDDIEVAEGTSLDQIKLPDQVSVQLDDGTEIKAAVQWDTDSYQGDTPGTYTFTGQLILPEEIQNTEGLTAAVKVIVRSSAGEWLDQMIRDAEALDPSAYTAESWAKVREALEKAEAVKNDPQAAEQQKKEAAQELKDAMDALVEQAVADARASLEKVIGEAQAKTNKDGKEYTVYSWNAMQAALESAKGAVNGSDADQLKAAEEGLSAALRELVETGKLYDLIDQAAALDENLYTEESWYDLQKAVGEAMTLLVSSEPVDQTEIDEAVAALEKAVKDLESLPGEGGGNEPGTTPGEDGDGTGKDPSDQPGQSPEEKPGQSGTDQPDQPGQSRGEAVATGDHAGILVPAAVSILAVLAACGTLLLRRKRNK